MKFIIGSEEVFKNFIDSISKDDKIAILSHTDLDGLASVFFFEKILDSLGLKAEIAEFIDFKPNMLKDFILKFEERGITKVFITDLNVDNADADGLEKLRDKFDVLLIDHHLQNSELKNTEKIIKSKTADCVAFVMYNFAKEFYKAEEFDWLVCAAMLSDWSFRDEDNMKFLKEKDSSIDREDPFNSKSGEFAKKIPYALKYFNDVKKVYSFVKEGSFDELEKAAEVVSKELEKAMQEYRDNAEFYPEKNLYFYYANPRFEIGNIVVTILSQDEGKSFLFAYDIDNGRIKISFRNNFKTESMNELAKKAINGLKSATGGGHIAAASATIMKEDFEKFKKNLLE